MINELVKKEFKKITGFELTERRTNFIEENLERKDMFFEHLSRLAFDNPKKLKQLKKAVKKWLAGGKKSETLWALAGAAYYCSKDFLEAEKCFRKAVVINPQNVDNWVDLAFTLRHSGEAGSGSKIFFNLDHFANA